MEVSMSFNDKRRKTQQQRIIEKRGLTEQEQWFEQARLEDSMWFLNEDERATLSIDVKRILECEKNVRKIV
jgi:hypothetical protein